MFYLILQKKSLTKDYYSWFQFWSCLSHCTLNLKRFVIYWGKSLFSTRSKCRAPTYKEYSPIRGKYIVNTCSHDNNYWFKCCLTIKSHCLVHNFLFATKKLYERFFTCNDRSCVNCFFLQNTYLKVLNWYCFVSQKEIFLLLKFCYQYFCSI